MKKMVLILIFITSLFSFAINNEAMIDYIIKSSGGKTDRKDAQIIIDTVSKVSKQYNFPEAYIYGIIETESNFRNLKANKADARGVMQVTPGTSAKQVGCSGDLYNIAYNIECGVKYLDWMRKNADHFGIKNLSDLAAAYNCGPNCFKSGKWKNIKETTNYIKKVPGFGNKIASVAGLPPLDMNQFPAGTTTEIGSTKDSISKVKTDSSLLVDWDEISSEFTDMISKGTKAMEVGLLILLSVLTVLEIMWVLYSFVAKIKLENIWTSLLRILIRFGILAYIISNANWLIESGYELFKGIGSYFIGNDNITLNNIWNIAGKETAKILKIINEAEFNKWNLIFNPQLFFEESGKILLLIAALGLTYYFVIRIIFEILMTTIQFKMALGLSWIFLPFDISSITKRELGGKPLNVFLLAGTKIVVILAMIGIVFRTLEASGLGEVSFKELEYQTIFMYITVGMVLAFLMNEIEKITEILSNGG